LATDPIIWKKPGREILGLSQNVLAFPNEDQQPQYRLLSQRDFNLPQW
jgi:hypothetical protein